MATRTNKRESLNHQLDTETWKEERARKRERGGRRGLTEREIRESTFITFALVLWLCPDFGAVEIEEM